MALCCSMSCCCWTCVAGKCTILVVGAVASAPVGDLDFHEPSMECVGLGCGSTAVEDRLEDNFVHGQTVLWRRQVAEPHVRIIVDSVRPSVLVELLLRVEQENG